MAVNSLMIASERLVEKPALALIASSAIQSE